jgi:DNA polymerase-3 subunit epsilon
MNLKDLPVLLIDCQTTGMHPTHGHMIEIAWALTSAAEGRPRIEAFVIKLPEGEHVPRRVTEITGISDLEVGNGADKNEVLKALRAAAEGLVRPNIAVIHYAQFEKPFLNAFFQSPPPFEIVCSHALTKRLFPNLPSQNIRGTAGFFGDPVGQLKRAGEHVRATHAIWRGLTEELARQGVQDAPALLTFLGKKQKVAKGRYVYRLPSEKRLSLPDRPGIYRMIAKTGEVLYVGKATSLKSRVNSYFRGKAGRDKRKLELMAQVWDLNVTETKSALEAALLEADEIKKFNPPYNVVMKTGKRHLVFYAKDFSSRSRAQDSHHPLGPFRNINWLESLRAVHAGQLDRAFYEEFPEGQLSRALDLFKAQNHIPRNETLAVRQWLALGLHLFRTYKEPENVDDSEITEKNAEPDYSDEEVAAKFGRLLMRAGQEFLRSRKLTKMLNTNVTYLDKGESQTLTFRNGMRVRTGEPSVPLKPWHELGVETFDRMSVLLSELEKYDHRIIDLRRSECG